MGHSTQVRIFHYPYTYTFYTIEHLLDHHSFDVRFSDIGRGRILAHFDDSCLLIRNREGHMDLRFEPEDDGTLFTLSSTYYNGQCDDRLRTLRENLLRTIRSWLEREYSMTLPRHEGDIPRFRSNDVARTLIDRPTVIQRIDTYPVVKQMLFLGASMMIGGIVIDAVIDLFPGFWGMHLAILSGMPFLFFAVMIREGRFEAAMGLYAFIGLVAGLVYCVVTVFLGVLIIMFPVAYIDQLVTRIRVWNDYADLLEGTRARTPPSAWDPMNKLGPRGRSPQINVVGGKI
jgi:hypothetical protein